MKVYVMQGCYNYEEGTVIAVYATRESALSALEARRQAFVEKDQEEALEVEEVEFETDMDDRWVALLSDDLQYDTVTATEVDLVEA